jgi:hypothetical protein
VRSGGRSVGALDLALYRTFGFTDLLSGVSGEAISRVAILARRFEFAISTLIAAALRVRMNLLIEALALGQMHGALGWREVGADQILVNLGEQRRVGIGTV